MSDQPQPQADAAPVLQPTTAQTEIILKGLNMIQRNTEIDALDYLYPIALMVSTYYRQRVEFEQKPPSNATPS